MKYRELAEEILNYLAVQDTQGNEIAEEESLYYIEEIIEPNAGYLGNEVCARSPL